MITAILALYLGIIGASDPAQSINQNTSATQPSVTFQLIQPAGKSQSLFHSNLFKSAPQAPTLTEETSTLFSNQLNGPDQHLTFPIHPSLRGSVEPIPTIWPNARKVLCDKQK
jgi:hypothetical protein